jgi:hypothetical protein
MKLLSAEVSGSIPEGSEHYAQTHLLFGFEHESYLMPAPEQREVENRVGLEREACECYGLLNRRLNSWNEERKIS